MDNQKKPMARRKNIVGEAKSVEKKGEGIGTGPVGQSTQRPPQSNFSQQSSSQQTAKPQQSASVPRPTQTTSGAVRPTQTASSAQRPVQPSAGQYAQDALRKAAQSASQTQSSQQSAQSPFSAARTQQSSQRPPVTGGGTQQRSGTASSGTSQRASSGGTQRSSGGGSKLILLLVAAAVLFFFGKNFLSGGNDSDLSLNNSTTQSTTNTSSTTNNTNTNDTTDKASAGTESILNLLSTFMGGDTSSAYDFSGVLSGLSGTGTTTASSDQYFTTSMDNNTPTTNTTVASGSREKYTKILGGKKDQNTILVYLCGTDLESQNSMGTADLKEMLNASLSDSVNLIVYTGGCRRWRNNVVSSSANQIYQIKNGSLLRLEENMGTASMASPSTLAQFIQYGAEHFPANRMSLILWDHGGGSVSGYGYDERYGSSQSMTLAGINEALKAGGVTFDFIGFDACLMATVENGLMLSQYADYMIASEETEPGVGWYYTNWLSKLSANPSLSTLEIGKAITDDFVEVCNKQCRGQATTLSVVDLAELAATVPAELKDFSIDTNNLIQNNQYTKVSSARGKTREFAASTKIDQIDLVHFAKNLGTAEGKELADALQGAVKYNRTGGGISDAYGLSIYFPYKKTAKVSQIVSTYKAIGMEDEYTRCIQEFATLETSGQISSNSYSSSSTTVTDTATSSGAGSSVSGLLESLLGGSSNSYYQSASSNYSSTDSLESLLGSILDSSGNSGATGSILDLFSSRAMTTEDTADYIYSNHFDPTLLVWSGDRITLPESQWSMIASINKNLYVDDGEGYIDLGFDPLVTVEGNDLVHDFDGAWLSIDLQPVAYYQTALIEQDDCYAETGYVPALVNGVRANLILVFDSENPDGYIAGAEIVYQNNETETSAKNLIAIGEGTEIQFLCDYYTYTGEYQDTYKLGDPITLSASPLLGYATLENPENCRLTYCLTDVYQNNYWTPALFGTAE